MHTCDVGPFCSRLTRPSVPAPKAQPAPAGKSTLEFSHAVKYVARVKVCSQICRVLSMSPAMNVDLARAGEYVIVRARVYV